MRFIFISFVAALWVSCVSEPVEKKPEVRYRSLVEVENEDGTFSAVEVEGSEEGVYLDPKTKKLKKTKGWVDPTVYGQRPGKYLSSYNAKKLASTLKGAGAQETTLIVEELGARKRDGVAILAQILRDRREAVFPPGREYWWYEKQGAPAEPVELRTYAAFYMQEILNIQPYGVRMSMTKSRILFATKDKNAVIKDDLNRVWLNWVDKFGADYGVE